MPERRPLTHREHKVGALILIGMGAPAKSLRSTRTRVREHDANAPESGGEVRACLDDPDWLEVEGAGCHIRVSVRRGVVRVRGWDEGDPTQVERMIGVVEEALRSVATRSSSP